VLGVTFPASGVTFPALSTLIPLKIYWRQGIAQSLGSEKPRDSTAGLG